MQNVSSRWGSLFLFTALLFGGIVRFVPTIITGQPINDGGLFYIMIQDLKANQFLIPAFTSYNHLNIPFAYPPFSLYAGGLLSLSGIPVIQIVRWLPPLVSTLSILAFFWMASLLLDSKAKATLATLIYALIPRSFSWYVMGGGLSRAFGMFFLIMACASSWALFTQKRPKYLILTILCGSGAILSHPETGLHAASACVLIWFFKGRNAQGFRDSLLVALCVAILTSPWWGTVLLQHGLAPLRSALGTGGSGSILELLGLGSGLTEEPLLSLTILLGLIGFIMQVASGNLFLPIWFALPFIVEWRSATAISILPLSILAGLGMAELLIPLVLRVKSQFRENSGDWTGYMSHSGLLQLVLGLYVFYAFIGAFIYDFTLTNYVVPAQSLAAMNWIRSNTPGNARFVVLTGRPDPFSDPSAEWFPAITLRTSINTIQGREWLLGRDFLPFLESLDSLQACLDSNVSCISRWAKIRQFDFDYLYIEKHGSTSSSPPNSLLFLLSKDNKFASVFDNGGVAIFERK
jgi:hypothetical protein